MLKSLVFTFSIIVELHSCGCVCSSPKAISEEMSPIDYPESAVGPDLDIISLFTSASAVPPSSQSTSNDVQVGLLGHCCVQMRFLSSSQINGVQIQVAVMSK